MRRRRWLYWIVVVLIGLLLSAITSAVIYWRHTVPLAETSEVYRQYRHLPGVRAAFIRQMPINDTLRLDMTLLEAKDSTAFADLLRAMGKSEEYIRDMATLRTMYEKTDNGYNVRHSRRCLRGHPADPPDSDPKNNEVVSFFSVRMCIAVFHTHTQQEIQTVLYKSFHNDIDIDKQ